jgi:hypothetical protein
LKEDRYLSNLLGMESLVKIGIRFPRFSMMPVFGCHDAHGSIGSMSIGRRRERRKRSDKIANLNGAKLVVYARE